MLVSNGFMTRNISEKQLPEYKAKGYSEITEAKGNGDNKLDKTRLDDLKKMAEGMGIDTSKLKTKAEFIEAIEAAKGNGDNE